MSASKRAAEAAKQIVDQMTMKYPNSMMTLHFEGTDEVNSGVKWSLEVSLFFEDGSTITPTDIEDLPDEDVQ